MPKDDGYGARPRNIQKGEPRFGNQCGGGSSCESLGSGSTFGEPSSRMPATGDLRSEPAFPNFGGRKEIEGSRGKDSNSPTTGGYRSSGSGTEGS